MKAPPLLWSVHDVTCETVDRCAPLVDRLVAGGVSEVAILVVPAGAWSDGQLEALRRWEREGHLLGLHGWEHRAVAPRGIYHRVHSAVLSRDVAEHLGRPRSEVVDLLGRGIRWFAGAGLAPPRLYVPPAWALGAMQITDFRGTSIRWVETLSGIHDMSTRRRRILPLVGFEADTRLRALALRGSNRANALAALATRKPLRVAVHPSDLDLALSTDLRRLMDAGHPSTGVSALFAGA